MAAEISGLGMALVNMVLAQEFQCPILALLLMTCMTLDESHTLSVMPFPQVQKGFWGHQMR